MLVAVVCFVLGIVGRFVLLLGCVSVLDLLLCFVVSEVFVCVVWRFC